MVKSRVHTAQKCPARETRRQESTEVFEQMNFEAPYPTESFAAHSALVRFLCSVFPAVDHQTTLSRKAFSAQFTTMRSVCCRHWIPFPDVRFQASRVFATLVFEALDGIFFSF